MPSTLGLALVSVLWSSVIRMGSVKEVAMIVPSPVRKVNLILPE